MSFAVTPDGRRYLSMGAGNREPNPYHLRFALPWLCGDNAFAWLCTSLLGIAACSVGVALLALQRGMDLPHALVAALLWAGLPSTAFLYRAPVLVDAQGMAFAIGSALLVPIEPVAAVAVILIGASAWEKAPVFAALFAWSPWPLAGLLVPFLRYALIDAPKPTERDQRLAVMESKIATGLMSRTDVWRSPASVLLPWGACVAALMAPDPWWMAAWAVASAQLFVAYDTVRLIQHSAPAVCIAAAGVIPLEYALPILVAHWLNPWRGNGV